MQIIEYVSNLSMLFIPTRISIELAEGWECDESVILW